MNQILIGKFIALRRKEKNLTQEQLAEKLGVSNKTISKWETGKCMPDYSIVRNLCEELDITIAELMDGKALENNVPSFKEEKIWDLIRRTRKAKRFAIWYHANHNGSCFTSFVLCFRWIQF